MIECNTYFDPSNPSCAMKYGKVHENDAIRKYILSEKAHHSNLKALQTSFHVFQDVIFLGARLDGLLSCDCCQNPRPLEVKCLYSGRDLDSKEAAVKSGKFLEVDGCVQLKKISAWYTQIQMEMECIKANHAVLSAFLVDNDIPFITETKEKLKVFWIKNVLPKLKSRQSLPLQHGQLFEMHMNFQSRC